MPSVLEREGPGSCFTATGLPSIKLCQSCLPCQFQMDESLSDTYGYSECSGKPSYDVSCDMPGSCKSLKMYSPTGTMRSNTIFELADPSNATTDVCVKLCLKCVVHTLLNRVSIKGWDGTTSFSCLAGWIQA